mgnify:CR=1 FL=1
MENLKIMENGIKVKIKDSVLTLKNLQTDEVIIENVLVLDLKFENKVFTIVVDENILPFKLNENLKQTIMKNGGLNDTKD